MQPRPRWRLVVAVIGAHGLALGALLPGLPWPAFDAAARPADELRAPPVIVIAPIRPPDRLPDPPFDAAPMPDPAAATPAPAAAPARVAAAPPHPSTPTITPPITLADEARRVAPVLAAAAAPAASAAAEASAATEPKPDPEPERPVVVVDAALAPLLVAADAADRSQAPVVPVYPTRIPLPAQLQFDLRRGLLSGTGELRWQPAGTRYSARFEGRFAGMSILEWASDGSIDAAGLAPTRFTDRRRSKQLAANFQRDAGKITYSGPSVEHPLAPGTQDRLSWMLQLAAIAQARPEAVAGGARVHMWVSGARGDLDVWTFRSLGPQPLELDGQSLPTIKLIREPRERYDTRVEVWLDPARGHLFARLRLSSARDDDALDLVLRP